MARGSETALAFNGERPGSVGLDTILPDLTSEERDGKTTDDIDELCMERVEKMMEVVG